MGFMKEIASELEGLGIMEIAAYRSEIDGAAVIEIDTTASAGQLRVNLNDGNIWDGDPEEDVPYMLEGFMISRSPGDETVALICVSCNGLVPDSLGITLRAFVAAAKAHTRICQNGGTQ